MISGTQRRELIYFLSYSLILKSDAIGLPGEGYDKRVPPDWRTWIIT